jgi:hypothetical protein
LNESASRQRDFRGSLRPKWSRLKQEKSDDNLAENGDGVMIRIVKRIMKWNETEKAPTEPYGFEKTKVFSIFGLIIDQLDML